MVQVQSTWFPLIDRNPQKFVESIFTARESDYQTTTRHIYRSKRMSSHIELPVATSELFVDVNTRVEFSVTQCQCVFVPPETRIRDSTLRRQPGDDEFVLFLSRKFTIESWWDDVVRAHGKRNFIGIIEGMDVDAEVG